MKVDIPLVVAGLVGLCFGFLHIFISPKFAKTMLCLIACSCSVFIAYVFSLVQQDLCVCVCVLIAFSFSFLGISGMFEYSNKNLSIASGVFVSSENHHQNLELTEWFHIYFNLI
jgi:hypothetical protein